MPRSTNPRSVVETMSWIDSLSATPGIVGVQKSDQLALGVLDAQVAGDGRSLVTLVKVSYLREPAGNLGAPIIRSVIDDQDFDGTIVLRHNALKRGRRGTAPRCERGR